jgi:hypothetical protein
MLAREEERIMDRHKALAVIPAAIILLCSIGAAHAHKPLLSVGDNRDGTISVEAGFSDGASAAGHKIIIKDEKTAAIISEHKVGEDGTLELKKPSVAFTVTLDAGEGHVVTKAGPPPANSDGDRASKKDEPEATAPPPQASAIKSPAPAPSPQSVATPVEPVRPVQPFAAPQATPELSPGAVMALKMMITGQIVTATALIILLAAVAYFIGYTVGRKTAAAPNK